MSVSLNMAGGRRLQFNIEDILMFSLEYDMFNAVKECLGRLRHGSANLSSVCQTRLVIATMPRVATSTGGAAQLLNADKLLTYSQVLRGLQFIRTNCPDAGACRAYAFCALKLKKVILIHLLCNNADPNDVKSQLNQQFGFDSAMNLVLPTKNVRLVNVLKREINIFRDMATKLLENTDEKINYIQGNMWVEFNDEFWSSMHDGLLTYLRAIKSFLPSLKIEKLLEQDSSSADDEILLKFRSKVAEGMQLDENDVFELLHLLYQDSGLYGRGGDANESLIEGEESLENPSDSEKGGSSDQPADHITVKPESNSKTKSTSRIPTLKSFYGNKVFLKDLRVSLLDIKSKQKLNPKFNRKTNVSVKNLKRKTPVKSKQVKRHLFSPSDGQLSKKVKLCAVEVADLITIEDGLPSQECLNTTEESMQGCSDNEKHISSLSSPSHSEKSTPSSGDDQTETKSAVKENLKHCTVDVYDVYTCEPQQQCRSVGMLPLHEHYGRMQSTPEKKSLPCQKLTRRQLHYAENITKTDSLCSDMIEVSINAVPCGTRCVGSDCLSEGYVSESDYDDDVSIILNSENPSLPDFRQFEAYPHSMCDSPIVLIERLKQKLLFVDTKQYAVVDGCILSAYDIDVILNEF